MESKAFLELKYRALNYYLSHQNPSKEVALNWERRLPIGRSKYEHYQKAGAMLADLIKANVENLEAAVLIIPPTFTPIMIFADANQYERCEVGVISGAYQCGTLNGTAVVVEPTIPAGEAAYMLLFDFASGKVIRIIQGKYDYDADLAEVSQEMAAEREAAE